MSLTSKRIVCFILAFILASPVAALALDPLQKKEFDRILHLKMADLAEEAAALLKQKYPGENWDQFDFPSYVYSSESVEVGYKIAVKEPELLGNPDISVKDQGVPCYCFCDAMGHRSLLDCFWKEGKVGGEFDDHAAGCNICVGQAMLAFLWKNLGATEGEIRAGMEKKFEGLLKSRGDRH